jgi:ComF family protein
MITALVDALLAALLAPQCATCGSVLDRPLRGAVCGGCWDDLSRNTRPTSFTSPSIGQGVSIGLYEGRLRDILHALKYDGRRSVAPRLAEMMAAAGASILGADTIVVPVPLHRRRQRSRGFNQAESLASGLGRPVHRALRRTRWTRPQVELPAAWRGQNVKGAFAVRRAYRRALRDQAIVLVDDVMTTGATLDACARVLVDAGARDVRALTAARVAGA